MKYFKSLMLFSILAVLVFACEQNVEDTKPKTIPIEKIIVQDKTISLSATTEKVVATVLPSTAIQSVIWTSEDSNTLVVEANTGLLSPKKAGKVKVIATSTVDSTKKGEATVTISFLNSFDISLSQPSIYYGGTSATLTVTVNPATAQDEFICESENEDLEITKVTINTFNISVKNKRAKDSKVTLKVKPKNNLTLSEKTKEIEIKTIVPESISIEGEDKMYVSEELQFSVNFAPSYSIINKDVKWSLDSSYNESNSVSTSNFEISEDGKLKIKYNHYPDIQFFHGKAVRIKAISSIDDSISANKVITIYDNIAKIKTVNSEITEWTHCKESNSNVYNGDKKLRVNIKFEDGQDMYKKIIINEANHFSNSASLDSNYLEKTIYNVDSDSVSLITKKHTEGQEKTFYIFAIDPKTERPTGSAIHKFKLTIWTEPEGIEFIKGNTGSFEISKKEDGSYYSNTTLASGSHSFYVRLLPIGATKQEWLSYKLENASNNITSVEKGSLSADGQEYTFDINSSSGIKNAKFNFMVKINNKYPNPQIMNHLMIKYN